MATRLQVMLWVTCFVFTIYHAEGTRLTSSPHAETNYCGDWINFKNEKCFKIVDEISSVTKGEAENVCKSYSKFLTDKPSLRLVTIKNEEQQKFLNKVCNKIEGNIWLGLTPNNLTGQLDWSDGSKIVFSNFVNSNDTGNIGQCVKMNVNGSGIWQRVSCSDRNKVVCERVASWTLETLQGFLQDSNLTGQENYDYKSEPDCRKKMMRAEDDKDVLMKAAEKAMEVMKDATEVLKDATEKIADVEKREQKIKEIESSSTGVTESVCGQWLPYRDEKCLMIFESTGTVRHEEADNVCKRVSAELLTIKTAKEQEAFQEFLFSKNELVDNVWLGLKKKESTGQFEWIDETKLYYSNWANQTRLNEQDECVEMKPSDGLLPAGLWFKVSCKRKNAVICQKRPIWTMGTLQIALLNFRLEQRMKIDSLEKEISILEQEVTMLKENYEIWKKCPNNFRNISGRCYYFSEDGTPTTWDDATSKCKALDKRSSLTVFETQEEYFNLKAYIAAEKNVKHLGWWIGGSYHVEDRKWRWIETNQPFQFMDWCPTEPNNTGGKEYCVTMDSRTSCWNDLTCTNAMHFICERR